MPRTPETPASSVGMPATDLEERIEHGKRLWGSSGAGKELERTCSERIISRQMAESLAARKKNHWPSGEDAEARVKEGSVSGACIVAQRAKLLLVTLAALLPLHLPADAPGKASDDDPSARAPITHVRDRMEFLASGFDLAPLRQLGPTGE